MYACHPCSAREAAQRHPAVGGELDRERRRRPDADEDRRSRDRRLLDELERQPPADAEDRPPSGSRPSSSAQPITLSIALWRPTSSRTHIRRPSGSNRPVACRPPVRWKPGCTVGRSAASSARATLRAGRERRAVDRDLLERALAAHAAGRGRVEPAPPGILEQRPGDFDGVAAKSSVGPRRPHLGDQPLAEQEAERELLVVTGRAHRHGQRLAVDPDLERLLDRDDVFDAVVEDCRKGRRHRSDANVRDCDEVVGPPSCRRPGGAGGRELRCRAPPRATISRCRSPRVCSVTAVAGGRSPSGSILSGCLRASRRRVKWPVLSVGATPRSTATSGCCRSTAR